MAPLHELYVPVEVILMDQMTVSQCDTSLTIYLFIHKMSLDVSNDRHFL